MAVIPYIKPFYLATPSTLQPVVLAWPGPAAAPARVERREKGNLVGTGIPGVPAALTEKRYPYQSTRNAGMADWLPDGKGLLIATRFGVTKQLHLVERPAATGARSRFSPNQLPGRRSPKDATAVRTISPRT